MNKNHTNEPNCTKLVMPRQLVLPLDYGILIKKQRLCGYSVYSCTLDTLMNLFSQLMEAIRRRDTLTFNEVFYMCKRP